MAFAKHRQRCQLLKMKGCTHRTCARVAFAFWRCVLQAGLCGREDVGCEKRGGQRETCRSVL